MKGEGVEVVTIGGEEEGGGDIGDRSRWIRKVGGRNDGGRVHVTSRTLHTQVSVSSSASLMTPHVSGYPLTF